MAKLGDYYSYGKGDSLPAGSILVDEDGDTATKMDSGGWGRVYIDGSDRSPQVLNGSSPAGTLVHLPEAPPARVGDTVTTAAQLEALPSGTVVRDEDWYAWKKNDTAWYPTGMRLAYESATMAEIVGAPFTVLHIPATA